MYTVFYVERDEKKQRYGQGSRVRWGDYLLEKVGWEISLNLSLTQDGAGEHAPLIRVLTMLVIVVSTTHGCLLIPGSLSTTLPVARCYMSDRDRLSLEVTCFLKFGWNCPVFSSLHSQWVLGKSHDPPMYAARFECACVLPFFFTACMTSFSSLSGLKWFPFLDFSEG